MQNHGSHRINFIFSSCFLVDGQESLSYIWQRDTKNFEGFFSQWRSEDRDRWQRNKEQVLKEMKTLLDDYVLNLAGKESREGGSNLRVVG
jgi:hypothetical protein